VSSVASKACVGVGLCYPTWGTLFVLKGAVNGL